MDTIDISSYRLYDLHGGECLWTDSRFSRPKGTNEKTDEHFSIIGQLIDKFTMLSTGLYSKQLESEIKNDIALLKPLFTEEVFELIESKISTK